MGFDDPKERILAYVREQVGHANAVVRRIWQVEMNAQVQGKSPDDVEEALRRHDLRERLAGRIKDAATSLAIAMDVLGLQSTRRSFLEDWHRFKDTELGDTDWWQTEEDSDLESKPLTALHGWLEPLEASFGDVHSVRTDAGLRMLEYVLSCTARILSERKIGPVRETDIQRVMNMHLANTFVDYSPNVTISKPIKSFKPDGGVPSLQAAIEFKYVGTGAALKVALSAVNEDLSGYSGSYDWTRFFSVVYQTKAFATQRQFDKALKASGNAERWRVILVGAT